MKKIKKRGLSVNFNCKVSFFLFCSILLFSTPCISVENTYLNKLINQALAKNLANDRYWHILLHYKFSVTGISSLIDDPDFFLAPDGKNNPEAELIATLKAFFQPFNNKETEHPLCRFVARYTWLKEQLSIDEEHLNKPPCNEFHRILAKVDPRSAVLIYPGTHINSPASMFGHTLINIKGSHKSRLLPYAVNYSAFTNESNGFVYAFKGILGFYKGYFSVLPYYQKIKEYNDLERRDMWEYDLNLNEAEVRRMFFHIWELKEIYSDYFFFSENCSYNILFLLEVARPSLNLTDQCRPWVIPIDTVRTVGRNSLIKSARYRPSKATRISHILSFMDTKEQKLAQKVIKGERDPATLQTENLDSCEKIRILDLAAEIVEYRYFKKELTRDEYRKKYLAVLKARSKLGRPDNKAYYKISLPERPDKGHGSNRFGLGAGFREDDFFQEISLRPAYHHIMDTDDGYLQGAQIEFANIAMRYYPGKERVELNTLDLISILSLSPRDRFFRPISWKVKTGFMQKTFDDGKDHLVYQLNSGGGFAYKGEFGLSYFMFETDLQLGGRFDDSYCLSFGGSAGVLKTLTNRWKIHLWGKKTYYELGDEHHGFSTHLEQNLHINANNTLNMELSRHKEFGIYFYEVSLKWNIYW